MLMVGALNANKNQRLAIEALRHLPGATLTLVGEGPVRAELVALAANHHLEDRITWAGFQEATAHYYREADVTLVLSKFEGLPFVILESMASGTPVVATPVGGIPEVITDREDGYLLAQPSVECLVACLKDITPESAFQMGRAARQKIESGFTVDHMVNGLLEVIEDVQRKKGLLPDPGEVG